MNSKHIILLFAFCLVAFGMQAQSAITDHNVKVSSKKFDSNRTQFFVYSATNELIETGFYRVNKPDLTWIQYNKEGHKLMLAQFQNGVKQGTWYIWDEEGYLKYEIHYINNTVQRAIELDRTGALVASR